MNWYQAGIVFAVAFIVTVALVPVAKRLAKLLGAIDYPGNRRVNTEPVPRCGGIALYFGLVAGVLTVFVGVRFFGWELQDLYSLSYVDYNVLFLGVTAMFTVGLVDDITQLNAWVKLAGQAAASLIVVLSGISIGAVSMSLTGDLIEFGWLDYPVSVLYLLVFVNITNLIDGLDGLAAGIIAIVASSLLFLVVMRGNMTMALCSVAIIAACLGFLCYNFSPASIFMGDSGSMLLGLVVGILAIAGVAHTQGAVIMLVPLAIAGVPVLDTISAIVRRLRGHQNIGMGDLNHLHHRLMRSGLGQRKTVAVLWLCSAALAVVGCAISQYEGPLQWAIFGVLFVVVFFVIWRFGLFRPVLKHHYDNLGKVGPRMPRGGKDGNGAKN